MEYNSSYGSQALKISFERKDHVLQPEDWAQLEDTEHAPRWWLIRELVDNGQANRTDSEVHIPHEEVVQLSRSDQQLLQLPDPYPFDIRLDAHGTLNREDFRYDVGYFVHPDGKELPLNRTGAILHSETQEFVLRKEQYTFCEAVSDFRRKQAAGTANALRAHAEIKELGSKADVVLDSYLKEESVVAPDTIEVDVRLDEDAFVMGPRVQGIDNDALQKRFDRFPRILSNYTVTDESGERVRVAFTEEQGKALGTLKAHSRVSGEEREKLVDHPETILDPDVFDLDLFSERVVDLGFYKPTFYPFISPYESQWIPGFVVEASPEERKQVRFEDEADLATFEEALEKAKAQGDKAFTWDEIEVPVPEAERITDRARQQFEDPDTPITDDDEETGKEEDRVLIIRTNVEDEEYSEVPDAPSTEKFEHAYQPPPRLKEPFEPREHQKAGIAWMQSLLAKQYPGGLLADDMGLGKTFQVLSFIKWHQCNRNPRNKSYLIVAPVALLENWENEYDKFFQPSPPPVKILHGEVLRDCVHGNVEDHWRKGADRLSDGGMYITTYGSLRRYQLLFGAVQWAVVVLDEAQRIKNPSTQVTSSAKALKADFKLPMTGTPVENSLVDLWCLMDFVVPGLLGSAKEFAKTYQHPLKDEDTDIEKLGEQLREELGVYLKRRLKSQVVEELPDKEVRRYKQPMPKTQHDRYRLEIEQVREAKEAGEEGGQAVLKALHTMRIISDHPYLPDRNLERVEAAELIPRSAKLKQTVDILRSIQQRGEKAILYADRKVTQRMLAKVLRETFGIDARVVNGDTPAGKTGSASKQTRQELIDAFEAQDGFGALVMSPIAAGLGLNITAANHVIHYARHWNPAKEDQATDRVYRIGQSRDVHVYYPMCTIPGEAYSSFDEILDDLLQRKRALAEASLFPSKRVEVKPDDLYNSVLDEDKGEGEGAATRIDLETASTLDPYLFEALVASLWKKEGFHVHLTPAQSDRGVDVVAEKDGRGVLIQVKQTKGPVGQSPIREVVSARAFYEKKFNSSFHELNAVTSASRYTRGARELARQNGVTLLQRAELSDRIEQHDLTLRDIREQERQRMVRLMT